MQIVEVKRMKQKILQQPNKVLNNPILVAEFACSLFNKVEKETIYFLGLTNGNAVSSAYELEHSSLEDFILDRAAVSFMLRELLLANTSVVLIVIQSPVIIQEKLNDTLIGLIDMFNKELMLFSMSVLDIVNIQLSNDGNSVVEILSYLENDMIKLDSKSELDGMVL